MADVNIKLRKGALSDLPSSKSDGHLYFATVDDSTAGDDKKYTGYIYLDSNGQRYSFGKYAAHATTADTATTADHATTADTAGSASKDGSGNIIANTYMPKSGGRFTGPISFQASSLPQKNLEFLVGIDSFASGGEAGWQATSGVSVGNASTSGHANTAGTAASAASADHASTADIANSLSENAMSSLDGRYVNIDGDTMTGTLNANVKGNLTGQASRALKLETYTTPQKTATYGNQWQVAAYWETGNGPIRLVSDQNQDRYKVKVDEADNAVYASSAGSAATATSAETADTANGLTDTYKNTLISSLDARYQRDYTIGLFNGTSGNPKPVKFATVNYSTCHSEAGVMVKIGMVSGHGNGSAYTFLQDAIINVNYLGAIAVNNFKYYGAETPEYDSKKRQYGDIFWVHDATNKVVDFYCLMGQYATVKMTPYKRLNSSDKGTITQHTAATVYSTGTKVWANNAELATLNDIPTDYLSTAGGTITGSLNIGGGLSVGADTSIGGDLSVTGQVSSTAGFKGNLEGKASNADNATIAEQANGLTSSALTTLDDRYVNVSGDTMTGSLKVKGALETESDLKAGGALNVTGVTTLGSTLDVTGAATFDSNLTVAGNTTLGNANTDTTTIYGPTYKKAGTSTNKNHLYLEGAASSSASNTTQIVFKEGSTEHIAISSNDDCFVVNKNSTATDNQLVFYLGDKASTNTSSIPSAVSAPRFYGPVTGNVTGNLTGNASSATYATEAGKAASAAEADTAKVADEANGLTETCLNTLDNRFVNVSGDTMTGRLNVPHNGTGSLNLRTASDSYDGIISYQTAGNEAMVFSAKHKDTSFIFATGEDTVVNLPKSTNANSRWQALLTPGLQVKHNSVSIGKLIANGVAPTHKLHVEGDTKITGNTLIGSALDVTSDTTLGGTLGVSGAATFGSTVSAAGQGSFVGLVSSESNNFISHGNEFNFIPNSYAQPIYFNYQTIGRDSSGTISEYVFLKGTGSTTDYSNVRAKIFYGNLSGNVTGNLTGTASHATKADSATTAASADTAGHADTADVANGLSKGVSDSLDAKYLGKTENAASASKLNTSRYIDGVSFDGSGNIHHYGTCSTAAATAEKAVSVEHTFSLVKGARVTVTFTNSNTAASGVKLKVGSTEAKEITVKGSAITASNGWESGSTVDFVYTGSKWEMIGSASGRAVFDGNGDVITDTYVKKSGDTMTGGLTLNGGAITSNLENKFTHKDYCSTMIDIASGIGASLKNTRAVDNQLVVGELLLPSTASSNTTDKNATNNVAHELGVYKVTGISSGKITGKTLVGKFKETGWHGNVTGTVTGDLIGNASTATSATTAASADHATTADTANQANSATTAGSADSATKDGSGNVITSTYMPKSGGQFTGPVSFYDGAALPEWDNKNGDLQYILGISAFASGGKMHWEYANQVKVGSATTADTATAADHATTADKATQLNTARKIKLTQGATGTIRNSSGTEIGFDGSADANIRVDDIKEAYISWGGKNITGNVTPIDLAASSIHSANRFQFAKPAGITIEYSQNGGSSWTTYSTTDVDKINLVSGVGANYYIGGRSGAGVNSVNDQLRVSLKASSMQVYTRLHKLLINITTNSASGSTLVVEASNKGSATTFKTLGTYSISGWSGWNSIPINNAFGGSDTQTTQYDTIRLTFKITGVSSGKNCALTLLDIVAIGGTYWTIPSNMAKTGHLYTWDASQNATFPAKLSAGDFAASGSIAAGADISVEGDLSVKGTITGKLSGNASTADAFSSGTTVKLTGDVTGESASSTKGWSIATSLPYRLKNYQTASGLTLTNPNDALETGFYYINGATNRPSFGQSTNNDYRILTTAYSNIWGQQIATDFRCNDIFFRRIENGTWKDWIQFITSENLEDRAKQVLDDDYVNVSGDTMTGRLTLNTMNTAQMNFRPNHSSYDSIISYQTAGNEAMVFSTKNAVTSFMFVNGEDTVTNVSDSRWTSLTPGLQIKQNSVSIGKLIANGATPTHKLHVEGDTKITGSTIVGSALDVTGVTTLGSTLDVTGAATLNSTLDVTGVTTLNNNLVVKGNTTLGDANTDSTTIYGPLYKKGDSTNKGHIYLDGAAGASTSNTTQIIFRQGTTEHIALSSNDDCFVINPSSTSSSPQIALYLGANATSSIPGGLTLGKQLSVGTTASISGNTTIGGTLGVTGATTLTGKLTANGGAAIANGLTVTGNASITNLLTVGSGSSNYGIKVGDNYINAINKHLIFQNTDQIRFGPNDWDYNKWAGLRYDASNKYIYLGLADGTVFTANNAQSGGRILTPGISYFHVGNQTSYSLDSNGGGNLAYVGDGSGYLAYVGGGTSRNLGDNQTGYLTIAFPAATWGSTTMVKFKVSVFNYSSNTSVDYHIGVYTYNSGDYLYNPTAFCLGKKGEKLSNLPVRFGYQDNKYYVYIGESNTNWNYPNVTISDITLGHNASAATYDKWKSGWSITFGTTLASTIKHTLSNTYIGYHAYNADKDGSGNVITDTYLKLSGGEMTASAQIMKLAPPSSSWFNGRDNALIRHAGYTGYNPILSMKTTNGSWELGPYSNDYLHFVFNTDEGYATGTNTSGEYFNTVKLAPTGRIYGAVWNDYAEFRNQTEEIEPGYCVASTDNGQVYKTTERLQSCDGIVSDTFGFAIGENDECQTPLAVAGRVLAYCAGDRNDYHAGDVVCAGPNGKVYKMTREEIREWPDRIVGVVSEIPSYDTWGSHETMVNNRIWIKVK